MGVPKFFRWLAERYPKVTTACSTFPTPIFDNLYIDLNGIVHQCAATPNPLDPAKSEKEIFLGVFGYIELLVSIVQPSKLLYLAIDGVAPRAKMNEQRQRRFRTAKDYESRLKAQRLLAELTHEEKENEKKKEREREAAERKAAEGEEQSEENATEDKSNEAATPIDYPSPPFDSNCISSGTSFMERLNDHVRYYVHARINEDSRWQKLKVIVSGSDEPGEGEHKIAEYIRREKMQPNYDPNTRHCLYGMDFDLILLGLCFHEPYFSIIRERVVFKSRREETSSKEELSLQRTNDFQFVHLSLLRHYLDLELRINRQAQNLERVLDDFIFMTFFVGNDFLPTLPSLEIDDGGITTLFSIYRELAPGMQKMTGQQYLVDTKAGTVNTKALGVILRKIGEKERDAAERIASEGAEIPRYSDEEEEEEESNDNSGVSALVDLITKEEKDVDKEKFSVLCKLAGVQNVAFKKKSEKKETPKPVEPEETFSILCRLVGVENVGFAPGVKKEVEQKKKEGEEGKEAADTKPEETEKEAEKEANKEEKEGKEEIDKKAEKKKEEDTPPKPSWKDIAAAAPEVKESPQPVIISTKKSETEKKQVKSEETTENKTPVVLSGDYKARYYTNRFKDVSLETDFKRRIGTHYLNALHWVLRYYFHPIPSWEFYFPYYASPLASDIDVSAYEPPVFDLGTPWKPFESLIAILPPVSAKLLPSELSSLITDPESSLKEFFPDTVDILQHHKNIEWKAIACLPFVKRDSVTAAIQSRLSSLSAEELKRNSFGGANVLKYDSNEKIEIVSPLSDFPSLQVSNVKVTPLVLPELSEPFDPVVPKGCQAAHPGFPTFTTLPHSPGLANIGANIIGTPSRRESVVIQPKPDPNLTNGNTQTLSKNWIGKTLWINWPYHLEAKCTGILTPHEEWHISKRGQMVQTSATTAAWKELVDRLTGEYRRSGITLGDVKVVLRVEPFVSLFFDKEAGVQKKLYSTPVELPIQLAVRSFPADIRYAEGPAPKVTDLFPSGSKVIYLGEQNFGCVGVATNQKSGNQTQWSITLTLPQPKEPQQFGTQIASTMKIRYINARDVATSLGITPLVLSRISSAIPIRVGRSTMELGLNIKFERRQLQTFGYTRRVAIPGVSGPNNRPKTVWEYSEKAVQLIAAYKTEFPEVFRAVEASPNAKEYHAEDIFGRDASPTPVPTTDSKNDEKKENAEVEKEAEPKKEKEEQPKKEEPKEEASKEEPKKEEVKKDAKEEIKKEDDSENKTEEAMPLTPATPTTKTVVERVLAMRRWLASSPAADLELVPCDSVFLSNEQLKAIEERAIEVGDLQATGSKTKVVKNVVAEEYFFIEQIATSIQAHQKFELGDRVVYALSSGVVPTGRRGVVVGIYRGQQMATVVFDEEFLSGNRLSGTLLGYRSALVPLTALLNLTHPLNSLMAKSTSGATQKAQKETLNLASARPPQIIGADKGGRRQQGGGGGRGGRGGKGGPSNPFGLLS